MWLVQRNNNKKTSLSRELSLQNVCAKTVNFHSASLISEQGYYEPILFSEQKHTVQQRSAIHKQMTL